jgi:ribulose-phosphate 3-epimerase
MAVICPTVTAKDPHEYREQVERLMPFAKRVHLDFADGELAPVHLVDLTHAWRPESVEIDVHLMFKQPLEQLEAAMALKPNCIIVHAEARGSFKEFAEQVRATHIKAGVALLAATEVSIIKDSLGLIDYVLVFSGDLGHFGGQADLGLLGKVSELKTLKPELEIGWDGGINADNAADLARAGVDVLNVGGFIQRAEEPASAYAKLEQIVQGVNAT